MPSAVTTRWGLLALLALAGDGLAQPEVVDWASIEVAPFEELVRPLQGPTTTAFTARASCLLAEESQTVRVSFALVSAPDWASVVAAPSTDERNVATCEQGYAEFEGTLTVTASDQAPGFTPMPIEIEMAAGPDDRRQTARAVVNVSASYFAILDLQLPESQAVIAPGGSHEFTMKLTNFGNAITRVETTLAELPDRLTVTLPPPTTLESKQQGGAQISADVPVRVDAPEEDGFVNRVVSFSVRLTSAYATDDSFHGDDSTASFLVTVRSGSLERAKELPMPAALGMLAIALAFGIGRRR